MKRQSTIQDVDRAFEARDYKTAQKLLQAMIEASPGNVSLYTKLAHAYLHDQKHEDARACFIKALDFLESSLSPVYSGLANLECDLGNMEKAWQWHEQAVNRLEQAAMANAQYHQLPVLEESTGKKKVIAYSLYGAKPKYSEGLLLSVDQAHAHYPDFDIWVYHDDTVPEGVIKRLQAKGVTVIPATEDMRQWHPTMWRFAAMENPEIGILLLRDADSSISQREKKMVSAWLKSKKSTHIIRDWPSQTPLMLAGLVGFKGIVFKTLKESIASYLKVVRMRWGIDQAFLRDLIWPLIKDDAVLHGPKSRGIKTPGDPAKKEGEHVGLSHPYVLVKSNQPYKSQGQMVQLLDIKHDIGTLYPVENAGGQAGLLLPRALAEKIDNKHYSLRLSAAATKS